jgi:DNA repair protein RadC
MRIGDWPEVERPRERLLRHGAGVLSEAELLAIFLRTGSGGRNAVELGRDLLARFGCLQQLFAATLDEVSAVRGVGPAKYVQLQAVVEMARRALREEIGERDAMSSPRAVREFLQLSLGGRPHEVFAVIFLDLCAGLGNVELAGQRRAAEHRPHRPLHINAVKAVATSVRPPACRALPGLHVAEPARREILGRGLGA